SLPHHPAEKTRPRQLPRPEWKLDVVILVVGPANCHVVACAAIGGLLLEAVAVVGFGRTALTAGGACRHSLQFLGRKLAGESAAQNPAPLLWGVLHICSFQIPS